MQPWYKMVPWSLSVIFAARRVVALAVDRRDGVGDQAVERVEDLILVAEVERLYGFARLIVRQGRTENDVFPDHLHQPADAHRLRRNDLGVVGDGALLRSTQGNKSPSIANSCHQSSLLFSMKYFHK
jgi:hypothetical protein